MIGEASASVVPAFARATSPPGRLAGVRPVFERDFLVFTSRPRFLVLRTLTVFLASVLFVVVLVTSVDRASYMGSSEIGPGIYGASLAMLPALVLLLAPVLAASCVCSERALQTLPIVLAAPVSPLAFVLAKFLSRLGVVLVIEFATLPLAGLCFLYGGVSGGLFLEFVAFLVAVAVFGTAAGVVASAWSRTVAAAARIAYLLAVLLPLAHYVAAMSLLVHRGPVPAAIVAGGYGLAANPFFAWFNGLTFGVLLRRSSGAPGWTFLAFSCGFAALAVALGTWRLARESAVEAASSGRPRSVSPIRFANPVMDRAIRGTLLRRPGVKSWLSVVLVLFIDAAALTLAFLQGRVKDPGWHLGFLCVVTFMVALSTMSSSAHSLAAERETGALDMLLATRLSAREVVQGKFVANLLVVAPLLAIALLHGLIAATFTDLTFASVLAWICGASALTLFFSAVGTWCSSAASTAGRAVMRAYAYLVGGAVVHGVLLAVFAVVAFSSGGSGSMFWYLMGASPFYVGIAGPVIASEGFQSEQVDALASWVLWTAAYVAVSFVVVDHATNRLAKRNEAR